MPANQANYESMQAAIRLHKTLTNTGKSNVRRGITSASRRNYSVPTSFLRLSNKVLTAVSRLAN